jgi:hypothetical protein
MEAIGIFALAVLAWSVWTRGTYAGETYRTIADPSRHSDTRYRHYRACACMSVSLPSLIHDVLTRNREHQAHAIYDSARHARQQRHSLPKRRRARGKDSREQKRSGVLCKKHCANLLGSKGRQAGSRSTIGGCGTGERSYCCVWDDGRGE